MNRRPLSFLYQNPKTVQDKLQNKGLTARSLKVINEWNELNFQYKMMIESLLHLKLTLKNYSKTRLLKKKRRNNRRKMRLKLKKNCRDLNHLTLCIKLRSKTLKCQMNSLRNLKKKNLKRKSSKLLKNKKKNPKKNPKKLWVNPLHRN